jgi:hypothetical protein
MQKAAEKLQQIQSELIAPKNLENKFGNYRYRSAESILEALKPHLEKHKAIVILCDEMVDIGGRIYVKSTASFTADGETISTTAFAREAESKKGMDEAQVTGACSSYSRKYALNGLFCIDDTKDADATNDHGKGDTPTGLNSEMVDKIIASFNAQATLAELEAKYAKAKTTSYGDYPRVQASYQNNKTRLNK